MEACESILLVKPEVFVYKIPPRTTNRGYRAADWNLQTPDWTGRMRLVTKGSECLLKLEDKNTGELFAKSPIDKYPGIAVEAVMDSSRYFVIRIQDDNGRAAFLGMGFADRGDSFDLNVALQDHFKWVEKTEQFEQEEKDPETKPQLDLSFKDGQTIKINMKIVKPPTGGSTPRSRPKGTGSGILPPPPGGIKIGPPVPVSTAKVASAGAVDTMGLLLALDSPSAPAPPIPAMPSGAAVQRAPASNPLEMWGEFATAEKAVAPPIAPPTQKQMSSLGNSGGWVQF